MTLGNSRKNTLSFQHAVAGDGGATLRPIIDGVDLLEGHRNSRGVDPDRLLPPVSSSLMPSRLAHRVVIGSCGCGDSGCGSLSMEIRRRGGSVTWGPAETGRRESIRQTYEFELEAYIDAVDVAAEVRPGEGQGRRVARAVTCLIREHADVMGETPHQAPGIAWVSGYPYDSPRMEARLDVGGEQHLRQINPLPGETDEQMANRAFDVLQDEVWALLEPKSLS